MSTTPTDTSPTDPHVAEVVESLERALTLLKRRTRDVLKLAHEREDLMARIEGRASRRTPVPAPVTTETAVHGESTVADHREPHHDQRLDAPAPEPHPTPDVELAPATVPQPAEHSRDHDGHQSAPEPAVSSKWARPTLTDVPQDEIDRPLPTQEPAHDVPSAAATDDPIAPEQVLEPAPAAEPEASFDGAAPESDEAAPIDTVVEDHAAIPTSTEFDSADSDPDETPPWESPDLEWSEDSPDMAAHVAPAEFPHPMPPVDARYADAIVDAAAHDSDADSVADDAARAAEALSEQDDSPFAAEFTEHVEEVGGRLESSPFDLDTPPPPSSYRPRSFQGGSAVPEASHEGHEDAPEPQPAGNMEAAWDDFAGSQETAEPQMAEPQMAPVVGEPRPASPASGSRLRDLVAQAQQSERDRASHEKSDFDLIREDASVSRYDKNSAKLPTVGISSEELSSSVASLRTSFTGDKKSGPSGREDDKPSRSDKKADKRAAKEAAKAAKAEAKRSRRKG